MPDFNDQFSRFMDQFQRDSKADSRTNEEVATTLRDLLEEQRKMREHAEELARQAAIDDREAAMELERERKRSKVVDDTAETGGEQSNSILGDLLKDFKSFIFNPVVLASAVGLAVADQMTSVNLRGTLFAGTILSKVGGARLMTAFKAVAGAPGKMATSLGKSLQAKGAMGPKPTVIKTSMLKPGEVIKHGSKTARIAGGALRGVGSTSGGILSIITSVLKPLKGILKPFMSVLKLAGKATIVLTPIIAIIEGVVKAMKVFQEGGSISEVIFGFLMGALESLTTGLLEGIATLGNWLATMFDAIPDIVGDIIDGVFDFAKNLFSGTADSKIGQMLLDFVYSIGPVLLDVGVMAIKLIWSTFSMVPKILYRLGLAIGGALAALGKMIGGWFASLYHWTVDSAQTAKLRQRKRMAAARKASDQAERAAKEDAEEMRNNLLTGMIRTDLSEEELANETARAKAVREEKNRLLRLVTKGR